MFSISVSLRRNGGRALAIALVAGSLFVTGVAAKDQNPVQKSFTGTVNETFSPATCPSTAPPGAQCAASAGSGKLGTAGKVTSTFLGILDLSQSPSPGCYAETSTGTLTARNGDQIFVTDDNGSYCPTGLTTAIVSGSFRITGGTGRFVGATGSGSYSATVDGAASVENYTGTISTPKGDD